mgnify:CR=1 FL=1
MVSGNRGWFRRFITTLTQNQPQQDGCAVLLEVQAVPGGVGRQQEVRDTINNLTQTANEAAQGAKANWDAQQQAKQEQQAQWAQQSAQYQAAPGQPS